MSRLLLAEDLIIERRGRLASMRMQVASGHVQTIPSFFVQTGGNMSDDSSGRTGSRALPRGRTAGPLLQRPRRWIDRIASIEVRGVKYEPRSERATR